MHLFVTDETNKNPVLGQFFIYGGLVVRPEQVPLLTEAVTAIRTKYGYSPGDQFKFHTRSRPDTVDVEAARLSKQELVSKLEELGIRMLTYVILHDIAIKKSEEQRMNFALNTVASSFHRLLETEEAHGIMLIDRADEQHAHLSSLFQHGIAIGGWSRPLNDRIHMFAMTADNESHLSSAVDIALGAFRYCVNAAGRDGSQVVASDIFPPLARILWGKELAGVRRLGGYGFVARPQEVRVADYSAKYDALVAKLDEFSGGVAEEVPDS